VADGALDPLEIGCMAETLLTHHLYRIGQNMVDKLDDKIRSFQLDDIGLKKRSDLLLVPVTSTIAPTTLITMAPVAQKDIFSDINSLATAATHHIGSDVNSLKSKGKGEISEAQSYVHSKADSITSAIGSEASSVVAKIESELIKLINEAYTGLIDGMNIDDFYNVHVMTDCSGTYVFQNGANVSVGESTPPTSTGPNSVHPHVDTCEKHSLFDPMSLIKVIYWIGIAHILAAFVAALVNIFHPRKWLALVNFMCTLIASIAMALASAVTHIIALVATKVINLLGDDIGIAATMGRSFLGLTWASTILMAINIGLVVAVYIADKRRKQAACPSCGNNTPRRSPKDEQ
jgi:hypothetical protein